MIHLPNKHCMIFARSAREDGHKPKINEKLDGIRQVYARMDGWVLTFLHIWHTLTEVKIDLWVTPILYAT